MCVCVCVCVCVCARACACACVCARSFQRGTTGDSARGSLLESDSAFIGKNATDDTRGSFYPALLLTIN